MRFKDLRGFIDLIEERGQLKRISVPVSAEFEMTELADRAVKSGGPAIFFENVRGHETPVVMNLFGTHERMAWGLGADRIEDLTARLESLLDLAQGPPSGVMGKVRALGDILGVARSQPKIVRRGPCQEVVLSGNDVDLGILPTIKCWPGDAGSYITLPLVVSRDPESGRRNVGMYRMQVYDRATTGMHWQTHKGGAQHYRVGETQKLDRLEVAVAIGGDPTTIWSGSMPLPPDMDEFAVAGLIRQDPVELVKCKTIDLEVPAQAEYVLEGYVVPGELRLEGPFGDHTGYYSPPEDYPVFHVTAMTHRKEPIYPTTMVGRPPTEDFFMGKAAERIMLPALRMALPEVVDMNMPAEGAFHNLLIVSMRKQFPGHVRKVMNALWGMGLLMLTKTIVVVDHDVNVQNPSEVAWRAAANINPETDIVFSDGPIDDLDHATPMPKFGSKMGIDATSKGTMDGRTRPWPEDIVMSQEIKDLVDRRWKEYGF